MNNHTIVFNDDIIVGVWPAVTIARDSTGMIIFKNRQCCTYASVDVGSMVTSDGACRNRKKIDAATKSVMRNIGEFLSENAFETSTLFIRVAESGRRKYRTCTCS